MTDEEILLTIVTKHHVIVSRCNQITDDYIDLKGIRGDNVATIQNRIARTLSKLYYKGEIERFKTGRNMAYCSKMYYETVVNRKY